MEEEGCGGKLLSEFFLRSLFSVCLERILGGNLILSKWLASIGWRKTLVLRHSLIERFLFRQLCQVTKFFYIYRYLASTIQISLCETK